MSESHLTVNVAQATRWHARVAGGTLRAHAAMCAPIVLVALWLLRHDLLSTAFPAGTDMLGLVTRAHENARWDRLLSPWDPGTLGAVRPLTLDNVLFVVNHPDRHTFGPLKFFILRGGQFHRGTLQVE